MHPVVRSFGNFRPNLWEAFDPNGAEASQPCARTFVMCSEMMKKGHSPDIQLELATGLIGSGAATELTAYERVYMKIPDPLELLNDDDTCEIPAKHDLCFAYIGACCEALRRDKGLAKQFATLATRMRAEFAAIAIRDGVVLCPSIITSQPGGLVPITALPKSG